MIDCHRFSKTDDRTFRNTVGRQATWSQRRDRCDIDDGATAVFAHGRDGSFTGKEHAVDIHRHHVTPALGIFIHNAAAAADSNIVVEYVESTPGRQRCCDHRRTILFTRDICCVCLRAATGRLDHRNCLFGKFDLAVDAKHTDAAGGEQYRRCTAVTNAIIERTCAGDDGDLAVEAVRQGDIHRHLLQQLLQQLLLRADP